MKALFVALLLLWMTVAIEAQSELSRAVVLRFLAEKGFVAGATVELDRLYRLQSVSTTAHGNGEFTVRFRATPER